MDGHLVLEPLLYGRYRYSYEAGRRYGTTEVIRQCTKHEAPLNLF